jgi:protein phosphatase
MRPIRDIQDVQQGRVLYHSAFGFARVDAVTPDGVVLAWDGTGDNLPSNATHDVLQRVYALCPDDGFFHRSVVDRAGLVTQFEEQPADALALLLGDLHGPQREQDLRDWVVGRELLTHAAFDHWWRALQPVVQEDARFLTTHDTVQLTHSGPDAAPKERLDNPLLPPGRRLDLALQHRGELEHAFFVKQALLAWRTGGTQVKDLAIAALREEAPRDLLRGLMSSGSEAIDAIIHGIRRASWEADDVDPGTHARLLDLALQGALDGGPVDNEGRLAATLFRWPSPGTAEGLSDVAPTPDGKRLLRATFSALPPKRAEELALELLDRALDQGEDSTAQWLGGEALAFALVDQEAMADRLDASFPELADWFRDQFRGVESKPSPAEWDDTSDDTPQTAEIDLSDVVTHPVPLGRLPARSGGSLLGLGLAMARALSAHHKEGRVVNPTAFSVMVLPNETMEIEASEEPGDSPLPPVEEPSPCTDVFAAAVLLLESLLGRPWPRTISPLRAIPYLRMTVPMLPPSSLAPLDAALHPDPDARPSDGLEWLALWQTAAVAEESRAYATQDLSHRMSIGFDSHIGRMKILLSQTNQDAIFVSTKGPLSLLCVCDGISTANAGSGDVASSIATHVVANLWEQALPRLANSSGPEIRAFLDRALRMANTAVCEAALRFAGGNLDGRVPMGTTCVIAIVHGTRVHMAWLGDSRAYLVGAYGASLLTADENQAGERLKAWHLRFVDRWDPAGFALIGYLGHFNELTRPEALPAHHTEFTLLPGERLVMCSDGVTDYIAETHPEVSRALADNVTGDDLDEIARRLVNLANRGGGGDNTTCVVASLFRT